MKSLFDEVKTRKDLISQLEVFSDPMFCDEIMSIRLESIAFAHRQRLRRAVNSSYCITQRRIKNCRFKWIEYGVYIDAIVETAK